MKITLEKSEIIGATIVLETRQEVTDFKYALRTLREYRKERGMSSFDLIEKLQAQLGQNG